MIKSIKKFCLQVLLDSGKSDSEALRIIDSVENGWYHPSRGDYFME